MAFYRGPQVVTDGLILALDAANTKSYPKSGTIWNDLAGNGTNITLVNGPTFSTENGGAIVFDGTDDYGKIPTLNTNSNFTISMFFKYTVSSASRVLSLVAGWQPLAGNNYLQIRVYQGAIQLINSNISNIGTFTNSSVLINAVYNLSIIRTGNTYDCYINGQYRSSLTSSIVFTTTDPGLATNGGSERYQGNIYNFYNYNRALTASEVFQNHNALKSRFNI